MVFVNISSYMSFDEHPPHFPKIQNKKDVSITYTPIQPTQPSTTPQSEPLRFNDIVEYRAGKASSHSSKPSTIEGIDTLASDGSPSASGASYKWRGKVSRICDLKCVIVLGY